MDKQQLQAKYEAWRLACPKAFIIFEKLANEIRDAGHTKYSAKTISEVIRWSFDLEKVEEFKLNNNYIALMARELIEKDSSFINFFELRRMRD